MKMNKDEILKKVDDTYERVVLRGMSFEIKEQDIILTTTQEYDKELLEKLINKVSHLTGKKIYLVRKEIEEPDPEKEALKGKLISKGLDLSTENKHESLIVGEFNQRVAYLAQNVREWNSSIMTVWGGTGLGKTHLLHSMGWSAIDEGAYVWLTDSNRFIDDVLNASKNKSMLELHTRWKSANLILFDDVQIMSGLIGKLPGIESELFNLIQLVENNKMKLVFASDRNPLKLSFDDRINYRMSVNCNEITRPSFDDRKRILDCLLSARNIGIEELFLDKLASSLTQNVRQLIGAINNVDLQAKLETKITIDIIDKIISLLSSPTDSSGEHHLDRLISVATTYLGVDKSELLKERGRNRNRIVAIAAAKILNPNMSVEKIAKYFKCSRKAVYDISKREKDSEDVLRFMNLVKSNRG